MQRISAFSIAMMLLIVQKTDNSQRTIKKPNERVVITATFVEHTSSASCGFIPRTETNKFVKYSFPDSTKDGWYKNKTSMYYFIDYGGGCKRKTFFSPGVTYSITAEKNGFSYTNIKTTPLSPTISIKP